MLHFTKDIELLSHVLVYLGFKISVIFHLIELPEETYFNFFIIKDLVLIKDKLENTEKSKREKQNLTTQIRALIS